MVLFSDDNGTIIQQDDNFDPKTGENLAINDFISKVGQKGGKVTPINIFQDSKGNKVAVPFGQEKQFTDLGLKPAQQIDVEQAATNAHNKVLKGDINYNPSLSESFAGSTADSLIGNTGPQIQGLLSKLGGGSYQDAKDVAQSLQANREKTNPISSTLGSTLGSALTLGATGGVSSIPSMIKAGAGLGALSEGASALNQDKDVGDIESEAAKGALTGGAEALAGGLIGKGIQKGIEATGKAGYGLIPSSVKKGFQEGLQGSDLTNPNVNNQLMTQGSTLARNLQDLQYGPGGVKESIGAAKGDIIKSLENNPDISHDDVISLINNEQSKLLDAYGKTAYSHEQESINNAYNLLDEAKQTLKLNPNSPLAIDLAKQKLGAVQFDDVKPIKKSTDALNAIQNVREGAKNYLQQQSDNLGGTNQAYKSLLEAEDADKLHSSQFTPSDLLSLGTDSPSPGALAKFDNFRKLHDSIINNPAVSGEIKNKMSQALSDISDISNKAATARSVSKGGLPNLANQVGYGINKLQQGTSSLPEPVTQTLKGAGNLIYGIPKATYDNLPLGVQKVIQLYPEYRQKFGGNP